MHVCGVGVNKSVCVNAYDDCDSELHGICDMESIADGCCLCRGGGELVDRGNMSYDKHIGQKTIVIIGGAHFSGTSLLEVCHNSCLQPRVRSSTFMWDNAT